MFQKVSNLVRGSAILATLLVAVQFTATSATVSFVSGDEIGEGNTFSGLNQTVVPHPRWQPPISGAEWVNGWGQTFLPNSFTVPAARFHELFVLEAAASYRGKITVYSDDAAIVYVNGELAFTPNMVLDGGCIGNPGGCEPGEGAEIDLGEFLKAGENRIDFDLFQLGSNVAGVMYWGEAESRSGISGTAPEPGTAGTVGAVLLLAVSWAVRRRRSTRA